MFSQASDTSLTRYLYLKADLVNSLYLAILDQKEDEALFWVYEWYYSGWEEEVVHDILDFCRTFYDENYPEILPYFQGCHVAFIRNDSGTIMSQELDPDASVGDDVVSATVGRNLVRPKVVPRNVVEALWLGRITKTLVKCVPSFSHMYIRNSILEVMWRHEVPEQNLLHTKDVVRSVLPDHPPKIHYNVIFMGMESHELDQYQTREPTNDRSTFLSLVCQFPRNHRSYHPPTFLKDSLRTNSLDVPLPKYTLWDNWLFHASFAPLWAQRIQTYGGQIIDTEDEYGVVFDDDDQEEAFYNRFHYEPDEQPLEIQDRICYRDPTQTHQMFSWADFCKTYGTHCTKKIVIIKNKRLMDRKKSNIRE